ncbi:hypothetical protein AB0M02_14185 [Actinoplanes sp. NPDC051861]|uniref:NACHT domain-containing protein n=1 Tax=Actinoplanes sp. NPDC051861 TaxID=3155170 RepID=UPI0034420E45
MAKGLTYAEALKVLGAQKSGLLSAFEKIYGVAALGGAVATGSIGPIGLFDARADVLRAGRALMNHFNSHVRGVRGHSRTQLLVAAHAVIVVDAFFSGLDELRLPEGIRRLRLSKQDQAVIADGPAGQDVGLVDMLLGLTVPVPGPDFSREAVVAELETVYQQMCRRFYRFVEGLAEWDALSETERGHLVQDLLDKVPKAAVERYRESYRALCADHPEFMFWVFLDDQEATRAEIVRAAAAARDRLASVDHSLSGLHALLSRINVDGGTSRLPDRLARHCREALNRPIAEADPTATTVRLTVPKLRDAYVNPACRVAHVTLGDRPAEDSWWAGRVRCEDIQGFLISFLTAPSATESPLLILGQPGSGKSVLTRVLAARLVDSGFLPVPVELRRAPADDGIQDQIEWALRDVTGSPIAWPDLVEQRPDLVPVVLLDGFDELLQSSQVSRSNYLNQVHKFQEREAAQGRHVAVLVTSRTVVTSRMSFPEGTVAIRLEEFSDTQIELWARRWNAANPDNARLSAPKVLEYGDLARQPLLLLMLALFEADSGAADSGAAGPGRRIGHAELYERLLRLFVRREVGKTRPEIAVEELDPEIDEELFRLSVVAFAMFNRGSQLAGEEEINADLGALLADPRDERRVERFQRHLTPAELIVGRFFFIHESQAVLDTTRVRTYEFLHATFGEYLIARLIMRVVMDIHRAWTQEADSLLVRAVRQQPRGDDLLFALLSWAPLTDRHQILVFLSELMPGHASLGKVLVDLFQHAHGRRDQAGYGGYRPGTAGELARSAVYSANLLLLALTAETAIGLDDLFGAGPRHGLWSWNREALFWKSQLSSDAWGAFTSQLRLLPEIPGFAVRLSGSTVIDFDALAGGILRAGDPGFAPQDNRALVLHEDVTAGLALLGDHDISMLLHALAPFARTPRSLTTFAVSGQGAHSAARRLADLTLHGLEAGDRADIEEILLDVAAVAAQIEGQRDEESAPGLSEALLERLNAAVPYIRPQVVHEIVASLRVRSYLGKLRVVDCMISVLERTGTPEKIPAGLWDHLRDLRGYPQYRLSIFALRHWVRLAEAGVRNGVPYGPNPEGTLSTVDFLAFSEADPDLVARTFAVMIQPNLGVRFGAELRRHLRATLHALPITALRRVSGTTLHNLLLKISGGSDPKILGDQVKSRWEAGRSAMQ